MGKKIVIFLLVISILLLTGNLVFIHRFHDERSSKESIQRQADENFRTILNKIVFRWDFEDASLETKKAYFMQDAAYCDAALVLFPDTSFAYESADLGSYLGYLYTYLYNLTEDDQLLQSLDEETFYSLNESLGEVWNSLSENNISSRQEKVDAFGNYLKELPTGN